MTKEFCKISTDVRLHHENFKIATTILRLRNASVNLWKKGVNLKVLQHNLVLYDISKVPENPIRRK